jgi:hypothetical protein
MRTTVDLPDDLIRAAKSRAAEQGESLKDLFARAIASEVGVPAARRSGAPVTLPLIGVGADPTVEVTNADLEAALADVDAEKYA